jgi:hypothetical protein
VAYDFSDIFSESNSDGKDSVIRRRANKTVCSFSVYSEGDSSDDD